MLAALILPYKFLRNLFSRVPKALTSPNQVYSVPENWRREREHNRQFMGRSDKEDTVKRATTFFLFAYVLCMKYSFGFDTQTHSQCCVDFTVNGLFHKAVCRRKLFHLRHHTRQHVIKYCAMHTRRYCVARAPSYDVIMTRTRTMWNA